MKRIEVLGLQNIPEIEAGSDLPGIIVNCAAEQADGIKDKDIIILTSKVVSKALGLTKNMSEVKPGKKALAISRKTGKDSKWVQMVFDAGHKILAIIPIKGLVKQHIMNVSEDRQAGEGLCEHEQAILITVSKEGRIHTCDAGIDGSNHPAGMVSFLPADPDEAAARIRRKIQQLTGKMVAVILADTEMIPFGTMDFAVGSAGIEPRTKQFARPDNFGRPKFGGIDLTAYELCSASALVFGQTSAGIPVAIIRGYDYQVSGDENIANTIWAQADSADVVGVVKETLRATSYAYSLKQRLLLKIASWFV
jgi:coenzyme F420-0:L-glutamate ligase/coenzyme F420-1:gamma-L-glutamate ligase